MTSDCSLISSNMKIKKLLLDGKDVLIVTSKRERKWIGSHNVKSVNWLLTLTPKNYGLLGATESSLLCEKGEILHRWDTHIHA